MEKEIGIKVKLNKNIVSCGKNSNPINKQTMEEKKIHTLPKDFFETVIECEVKLKEKFDIRVFQKLADYYTVAIEYYESINDPRFMIYNQNLSLLFSQTEAKKYISGGNIKQKFKKEKIKKKIESCDKKITCDKVKKFIKSKEKTNSKEIILNLINKDIDIQQNIFKKRLAEKKKRYQLSISDNIANNHIGKVFKNIGINNLNISESENNESIDLMSDKDFKSINKDISNINSNSITTNIDKNSDNENNENSLNNIQILINNNNFFDEMKIEDIKNDSADNSIKLSQDNINNNLNDSFGNKLDFNSETNNKTLIINKNNIKFTNKTLFLEKMKFNFDIYANDYYENFIKKISGQIIKDYCKNFNELTQNMTDLVVNSNNQQKEMEYLINSDSDDTYKKEINTIIEQLKDEEKISKEKLISENKEKLEKISNKYIGALNTFQTGHDFEMIKERFKLDTTKNLNTLVFK